MLTNFERETIICLNESSDPAHIFAYSKTRQKHLEGKLGLKPTMTNGKGGSEYEIDKKRIKPPRVPKKLSADTKAKLVKRLSASRTKSNLRSKNNTTVVKSKDETPKTRKSSSK
uniref:Uncharacterized protein n=1 Tax=viral metagenome TaxID=1070528 RepID=A0A6M3J2M6_9ZZZZ